ncbi:MAG: hypothetical protein JW821_13425, partial [Deltaproteobacteria bacterium]|nr:hypothetical protein [Deltaproteobacteria bacterium]
MAKDKDLKEQLKDLKKAYWDLEHASQGERECLLRVIQTLSALAATRREVREDLEAVRRLVSRDAPLPVDLIDEGVAKLKGKILSLEEGGVEEEDALKDVGELKERLANAYRSTRKIMVALLEDFFPLTGDLQAKASSLNTQFAENVPLPDLEERTGNFLSFVEELRNRILGDVRYVNSTFLLLLEQVKALEKTLRRDFGQEERLKEIEYFEMNVNHEMGSIVESFNIHRTVEEIKGTVLEKIENIRRLVSLSREEETRKIRSAQEHIRELNTRIAEVEKDAIEMGKRAERFEKEALKDGLTGLYNRRAFDMRIEEALEA